MWATWWKTPAAVPYGDIPHFKASTAPGHKGRLVFGTLEGQPVAVMQGRMHHYEGYSYEEVAYAVRVLRLLGCDTLIVTNAAGCINTAWKAGDLMLISDHIKILYGVPSRGARTCLSSGCASPTPPTCTPRPRRRWPGRPPASWAST
ncbi:MAG: purine-nucleoside phosphorylase [Oscillospiraceae bacterium]